MDLNTITAIYGVGAFQALLFTLLLISKKEKKKADKFLAGFFFIITIYFSNLYFYTIDLWKKQPDILFIITLVPLTYGPLLYFYVFSLLQRKISSKQVLLHLIPIVATYLMILPFIFHSREEKLLYFTDKFMVLPWNVSIGIFIQYLSAPVYFVWIVIILRKHKKLLKENASTIDKINLSWLQKLLFVVITLWMIDCINVYLLNYTNLDIPYIISLYIKVVFICAILILGFYGMRQGDIFTQTQIQKEIQNEDFSSFNEKKVPDEVAKENVKLLADHLRNGEEISEIRVKDIAQNLNLPVHVLSHVVNMKMQNEEEIAFQVKKKLIPDCEASKCKEQLINYMRDTKSYLNNELRIQDISVELNIPSHILSYIINNKLGQNFYDFVNTYRIEEVKRRLQDHSFNKLTISAIAFDCGFNSKATFNRLFKKYTGTTPSQYKK